jgi:hypothetical protein
LETTRFAHRVASGSRSRRWHVRGLRLARFAPGAGAIVGDRCGCHPIGEHTPDANRDNRAAMRILILLAIVGCHSDAAPARPQGYAAMTEVQRCLATEERALRCFGQILWAQSMRNSPAHTEMVMRERFTLNPDTMHKAYCIQTPAYADAIFEAWDVDDCRILANHVAMRTLTALPARR